ncbi:MAG TPA: hypothetical protein VGY58_01940, partial [Gemmataceae bacterium]|nr:hypothetical protein [Gemmataceae bacterium]
MRRSWGLAVGLLCLIAAPRTHGGLYYSGEPIAQLPSQWRGFLLDHRALRNVAAQPTANPTSSPLRVRYKEAAASLERARRERKLTADESADLGAAYVRLGEAGKAVELLRSAQRQYPNHFRIAANLGTAWQVQGNLGEAGAALRQAVRLAPGKQQKAEELQLKLVQQRQRPPRDAGALDDLFGVRLVGEKGEYEPGKLALTERNKLPADAVALVQQLALWLPADGRLLWQLAELAGAHGDLKTAAAMMDGCVTEFGMSDRELRRHRQLLRAAVDELSRNGESPNAKVTHQSHALTFKPRSRRPLLSKAGLENLPPVNATGVNALPWAVLADTVVDRQFKPTFARYLQELDGRQISLSGFLQPLREDLELGSFMFIEYPVGCWYCEMPDVTGIVFVELAPGKTTRFTRGLIKVT